eukprot:TRINITY_DN781_c0_g2_i2.p1 TRINITY_DN781_c0_g2~~TRINITY_DN781_c0_g2_i2.p1  ORF type:complete len:609 (+),score=187.79 TRINITY_DN781_c0_g2_i2:117-1943(+)
MNDVKKDKMLLSSLCTTLTSYLKLPFPPSGQSAEAVTLELPSEDVFDWNRELDHEAPIRFSVWLCDRDGRHALLEDWTFEFTRHCHAHDDVFGLEDVEGSQNDFVEGLDLHLNAFDSFVQHLPLRLFLKRFESKGKIIKCKYGSTNRQPTFASSNEMRHKKIDFPSAIGLYSIMVQCLAESAFPPILSDFTSGCHLYLSPNRSRSSANCACPTQSHPIMSSDGDSMARSPPYLSACSPPTYSLFPISPPSHEKPISFPDFQLENSTFNLNSTWKSMAGLSLTDLLERNIDKVLSGNSGNASPDSQLQVEKFQLDFNLKTSQPFFPKATRPGTPIPGEEIPRAILLRSAPMGIPRTKFGNSEDFQVEKSEINLSKSMGIPVPKNEDEENQRKIRRTKSQSLRRNSGNMSDLMSGFASNFQESLFSGHMSHVSLTCIPNFVADLGVCGKSGIVPPHVKIPFEAQYYHLDHETPYAATIQLDKKGYKVPPKGLIQLVLINPMQTAIKTFLVKYDLTDMPSLTKTFLRQNVTTSGSDPMRLQYAIQLKFVCPQKKKYYLYKNIRIIFAHRLPDDIQSMKIWYHVPKDPTYFPYVPRSSAHAAKTEMDDSDQS